MSETMRESSAFDSGKAYLGMVYAKALLGVSEAAGNTATVAGEFESLVNDVLNKLPSLDATLSSPRVPHPEKERILEMAFQGKMSATLLTFLKVVSRHGRLDCLRDIQQAWRQLVDSLHGRIAVEIRTAEPVAAELLQLVAARLRAVTGQEVDLKPRIDSDMLGGIIVRIGDTIYDGSVRNQLARMREETLDHTLQKLRQVGDRFVALS